MLLFVVVVTLTVVIVPNLPGTAEEGLLFIHLPRNRNLCLFSAEARRGGGGLDVDACCSLALRVPSVISTP